MVLYIEKVMRYNIISYDYAPARNTLRREKIEVIL